LSAVVAALGDGVSAGTVGEAAASALVVVAVPWASVPAAVGGLVWNGKIVIDAPTRLSSPTPPNTQPAAFDGRSSSEIVAELVAGARVVKAANTLPASCLAPIRVMRAAAACSFSPAISLPPRRRSESSSKPPGSSRSISVTLVTGGRLQQGTGGPLAALNLVRLP
jgi:8-hydroxy-5-deazaflavin:NADPH oxidoreductase